MYQLLLLLPPPVHSGFRASGLGSSLQLLLPTPIHSRSIVYSSQPFPFLPLHVHPLCQNNRTADLAEPHLSSSALSARHFWHSDTELILPKKTRQIRGIRLVVHVRVARHLPGADRSQNFTSPPHCCLDCGVSQTEAGTDIIKP